MRYTVNACNVEDVQKVFNRYAKKAAKAGLVATMNILETYGKEVPVYEIDYINQVQRKTGKTIIEVTDIEINFPNYKLGDYTVAAVIEHGEEDKNLVYPCGDYKIPNKYNTGKGICEHCGTNHNRVKTILLIDNKTNEFKQVGTACLKEYTGVDEAGLVRAYIALDSILNDYNINDGYVEKGNYRRYEETEYYLAQCIHLYYTKGYNKNNKEEAYKVKENELTETDKNTAKKVIEFFTTYDPEDWDSFMNNIKNTVTNAYCKPYNGFVAYAVVAYEKEVAKIKAKAIKEAENAKTDYVGNIGDRITVNVEGRVVAGYDTQFGYTFIYKFTDETGKVYIWKTTKDIELDDNGNMVGEVTGTIKEHNEYNGERQNVLTRCKIKTMIPA